MEKGGWVAVIVALITTLGVLGSKYLEVAKPDAAIARSAPPPAAPAVVTAAAAPAAPAVAPPAATIAPVDVAATRPSLDGTWTETQSGAVYRFDDNGNGGVTMRGDFGPVVVIAQGRYGSGAINWTYTINTGEMGRCDGTMPTPGQIQATCMSNRTGASVVMFRKA